MQTDDTEHYARLSCCISHRIKHQAEEAASPLGQSITDFTEAALAEKAQAVFKTQERITLSKRDFDRFVALIENPMPPTPELQNAMAEFSKLQNAHPQAGL